MLVLTRASFPFSFYFLVIYQTLLIQSDWIKVNTLFPLSFFPSQPLAQMSVSVSSFLVFSLNQTPSFTLSLVFLALPLVLLTVTGLCGGRWRSVISEGLPKLAFKQRTIFLLVLLRSSSVTVCCILTVEPGWPAKDRLPLCSRVPPQISAHWFLCFSSHWSFFVTSVAAFCRFRPGFYFILFIYLFFFPKLSLTPSIKCLC